MGYKVTGEETRVQPGGETPNGSEQWCPQKVTGHLLTQWPEKNQNYFSYGEWN